MIMLHNITLSLNVKFSKSQQHVTVDLFSVMVQDDPHVEYASTSLSTRHIIMNGRQKHVAVNHVTGKVLSTEYKIMELLHHDPCDVHRRNSPTVFIF